MRLDEIINESMTFTPYKYDEEKKYWTFVFPEEWSDYYDRASEEELFKKGDYQTEPKKNPNYRNDLDLTLSNANMRDVLEELGFDREGGNIDIDRFIKVATKWLNTHGESGEVPTTVSRSQRGTVVTKDESGMSRIQPGGMGPTMYNVGRPAGYMNNAIERMLKIAVEGKKHGATVVAAV